MFALLEHTTHDGVHWDLLIEHAPSSPLAAWRLLSNPLDTQASIAAERLADHRRIYLTYEGPIRGDRGSVRRVDSGEASVVIAESAAHVSLRGRHLCGDFVIRTAGTSLLFERVVRT